VVANDGFKDHAWRNCHLSFMIDTTGTRRVSRRITTILRVLLVGKNI
jgi:hypothetical protein